MTEISDVLDGTDGVSITTSAQLTWTALQGDFTYYFNAVKGVDATHCYARAEHDLGSPDMAAEVTIVSYEGVRAGVAVRQSPTGISHNYRFYWQMVSSAGQWRLAKEDTTGSFSVLGTAVAPNSPSAVVLRLEAEGDTLRAYVDGVLTLEVTDTATSNKPSSNYCTIYAYGAGQVDAFKAYSLVATEPPPETVTHDCTVWTNGAWLNMVTHYWTGTAWTDYTATASLWTADFSKPLPGSHDFNYVNSSYASLATMETSTSLPGGGGPIFKSVIPANAASQGYRAHNELALVTTGSFPRRTVVLEYYFRVVVKGGMETTDCKVGYGMVGAPPGATNTDISYGGTKLDTSWSERTTLVPPNYLGGTHPWCMAYYLYAHYAGGQTYVDYGLRRAYRRLSDNAYFTPAEGVWYLHRKEIEMNTPGLNDGAYRAFIDGEQYVDLNDVQWNPSGHDIEINILMTQTFGNANIATQAVFDQSAPTLRALP